MIFMLGTLTCLLSSSITTNSGVQEQLIPRDDSQIIEAVDNISSLKFTTVRGVQFLKDGSVVVLDSGSLDIYVFDSKARVLRSWNLQDFSDVQIGSVANLRLDSEENIYVNASFLRTTFVFDTLGNLIRTIKLLPLTSASAFDEDNLLHSAIIKESPRSFPNIDIFNKYGKREQTIVSTNSIFISPLEDMLAGIIITNEHYILIGDLQSTLVLIDRRSHMSNKVVIRDDRLRLISKENISRYSSLENNFISPIGSAVHHGNYIFISTVTNKSGLEILVINLDGVVCHSYFIEGQQDVHTDFFNIHFDVIKGPSGGALKIAYASSYKGGVLKIARIPGWVGLGK